MRSSRLSAQVEWVRYIARDPRMGREVAIKLSAERFSDRFEREVRAVAALNHTNICQVYDVGPNYLVMELIEGPTLADRLTQGAVSLDEALAIARQIARPASNSIAEQRSVSSTQPERLQEPALVRSSGGRGAGSNLTEERDGATRHVGSHRPTALDPNLVPPAMT